MTNFIKKDFYLLRYKNDSIIKLMYSILCLFIKLNLLEQKKAVTIKITAFTTLVCSD